MTGQASAVPGASAAPHTFQSDAAPLRRVVLKHARDAFVDRGSIARQWRRLDYLSAPDYDVACRESDAFAGLLESLGVGVTWAGGDDVGLDSIYVRDAALVFDHGVVSCRMGKRSRAAEPGALASSLEAMGIPLQGAIRGGGSLEGGDAVWLDGRTLAVGLGRRTNGEGVRQLRALLPEGIDVLSVTLPDHRGPGNVFHLMSVLSPLADDLALVYPPLLPERFRMELEARGYGLVEVPRAEFESMGCNVLAVAPREVVALSGNPITHRRLEAVGVTVHLYEGEEISRKGCGGPTCLTRTLERTG